MFQDEKTTELDLKAFTASNESSAVSHRWTESAKATPTSPRKASGTPAISIRIEDKHTPLLIKLAAAVTILLLSLWLF